ncbi:Hypothetical predicted protein [Paramuricea clavata]|uniref:Uncharacterized protein n=1 Tax=Paramuricea clavata TaxID=317549 RepID=A0A6S7FXE4_PARCT|nr:Hypothetical predicted protein [Paramuricea clavata]
MNELRTNEFYLKKLYRSAQVTDADKDGVITRADYDLMIKRYNELGMPEENKQELSDAMYGMCGSLGLTDYSKSLTYDEIVQSWIDNVEKGGGFATVVYDKIFRIVDIYKQRWKYIFERVGNSLHGY